MHYDKNRNYLRGQVLRDHLFPSSKVSHKSMGTTISAALYERSAAKNRSNTIQDNGELHEKAEDQAWHSNRAPADAAGLALAKQQPSQSNNSNANFLPGFDSRGNVGISSDPNEFGPRRQNPS